MLVGRRLAGMPFMRCPSMKTSPVVGSSIPARIRSSVVLPQPEAPSSEKNSPRAMSKVMPFSA